MATTKTLKDLFVAQLADMYYAEKQLVKTLPRMAKAATHEELRTAFENHLAQTENHVSKVENVFEGIGQKPRSNKCEAMVGLLKEGEDMAAENRGSVSINPALIAAAQKVEHYEIATYGCLQEWAAVLGYDAAEATLGEILEDEKNADELLTQVARSLCNESAVATPAS